RRPDPAHRDRAAEDAESRPQVAQRDQGSAGLARAHARRAAGKLAPSRPRQALIADNTGPRHRAAAADPALPVRWRRPLEGEAPQALRGWATSWADSARCTGST